MARLDAALERWKLPRFRAVFFTVLLPGIISFPSWYKQLIEFLGSFGVHMPTNILVIVVSNIPLEKLIFYGFAGFGYLLAVPVTAFLAKRGLFIGRQPERICFPGGQGGSGAYVKEKEILGNVGLHARETPIDLWLLGVGSMASMLFMPLSWNYYITAVRAQIHSSGLDPELVSKFESKFEGMLSFTIGLLMIFLGLFIVAALRRRRTGRA